MGQAFRQCILLGALAGLISFQAIGATGSTTGEKAPVVNSTTPQLVDTSSLPDLASGNDNWITRNPYRSDPATYAAARKIGEIAFALNCARCHGAHAISDGLIPDLRYLDPGEAGDEWFITRFHHGLKRDGKIYMPPMGDALGQKTGWAIRSWLDGLYRK